MFVEHKEVGERIELKPITTKLSTAIREGIKIVTEHESYCGCAIGAAYTFLTGRNLDKDQWHSPHKNKEGETAGYAVVAQLFGVPEAIVEKASTKHLDGEWSRSKCADWIESKGY